MLIIFVTHHSVKLLLNEVANVNILFMLITLEVFQLPILPLNELAL